MWPEKLPQSVLDDWRRQAEVRVFRALSDRLGDRFEVFYSSPWLGTDRFGNEVDGNAISSLRTSNGASWRLR